MSVKNYWCSTFISSNSYNICFICPAAMFERHVESKQRAFCRLQHFRNKATLQLIVRWCNRGYLSTTKVLGDSTNIYSMHRFHAQLLYMHIHRSINQYGGSSVCSLVVHYSCFHLDRAPGLPCPAQHLPIHKKVQCCLHHIDISFITVVQINEQINK